MNLRLGKISKKEMREVRPLNEKEAQSYFLAKETLKKQEYYSRLMYRVVACHDEFTHEMESAYAVMQDSRSIEIFDVNRIAHEINHKACNFFSAFRTFLDQSEARIKREFGEKSNQSKLFKEFCAEHYDDGFAYGFFYKLRNFAMHIESDLIKISSTKSKDGTSSFQIFLLGMSFWRHTTHGEVELSLSYPSNHPDSMRSRYLMKSCSEPAIFT